VLVIAAVPAPFHRAQLGELLLPIPEHMRFYATQIADFTDGEVAFGRNGRKSFLQGNQCTVEESYEFTLRPQPAQTVPKYFFTKGVSRRSSEQAALSARQSDRSQEGSRPVSLPVTELP